MRQRKITRERKPSSLFPINIKSPPFNVLYSQNFSKVKSKYNIFDTITIIKSLGNSAAVGIDGVLFTV